MVLDYRMKGKGKSILNRLSNPISVDACCKRAYATEQRLLGRAYR